MYKIRKTIKTRERTALAVARGDEKRVVEVAVTTFTSPRNESSWKKLGREVCSRHDQDFICFIDEPEVVVSVYEMDITDFLLSATLVEPKVEPKEKEEE